MIKQINIAAESGADGIVFGILDKDSNIAVEHLITIVDLARVLGLSTTFHRAFDAVHDQFNALDILINNGVDRILTSGTAWGKRLTAIDGLERLKQIIEKANNSIEIIISGGISNKNTAPILETIMSDTKKISVHSYSGVQENGYTIENKVRDLVQVVTRYSK